MSYVNERGHGGAIAGRARDHDRAALRSVVERIIGRQAPGPGAVAVVDEGAEEPLLAVTTVPMSVNAPLFENRVPSFWLSGVVAGVTTAMDEQVSFRSDVMSHGMKSTSVETGSPVPAPTAGRPIGRAPPVALAVRSGRQSDGPEAERVASDAVVVDVARRMQPRRRGRNRPCLWPWIRRPWPAWAWIPTSLPVTVFLVTVWLVPSTTMPKPSPVEPLLT